MKPPGLIRDLYSDLRDRKLLPLVAVLPLAIVAVPLLLGRDAPPPVPPAAAEAPLPEGAPSAAVLTAAPTLRDYRERLDQLASKNPFAGEALETGETPEGGRIAPLPEAGTSGSSGSGGSKSFNETFDQTVSESSNTSTESTEIDDSNGVSDSGGGSQWYEFQLDVETGPAGDTSVRNNLGELTVLPSESNPVAVYLGIAKGGKDAVFMVSPDVVGVSGGGSCSPSPANCQLLTLSEGEEEKFDYAPSGEPDTFVIEIKDIRFVPVKNPVERAREAGSVDAAAAASGARAFYGD